jgi:heme exporter protein CcmD
MTTMLADPHIGFVVAAYCVSAAVIAAMIASVVADYRRLSTGLDKANRALAAAREDRKAGAHER